MLFMVRSWYMTRLQTHHIRIVYELTKAHTKLQHESSYLGFFWYILGPLLLFLVLLAVFASRFGGEIPHYPLYLLLGIILWNFFSAATGRSIVVLQQNAALLKSAPIPKVLFIAAAALSALVSHCFEIIVYLCFSIWYGVLPTGIAVFGVVLLLHVLFTFGCCLLLSGLYVHVRDVGQIWSIVTRTWWFATPILYAPLETGIGAMINTINPLYYSIDLARSALIYHEGLPTDFLMIFIGFTVAFVLVGWCVFSRATHRSLHLL